MVSLSVILIQAACLRKLLAFKMEPFANKIKKHVRSCFVHVMLKIKCNMVVAECEIYTNLKHLTVFLVKTGLLMNNCIRANSLLCKKNIVYREISQ